MLTFAHGLRLLAVVQVCSPPSAALHVQAIAQALVGPAPTLQVVANFLAVRASPSRERMVLVFVFSSLLHGWLTKQGNLFVITCIPWTLRSR